MKAQDVTTEVADVDSRLRTAQASVDRLRTLLGEARTAADLVVVEAALAKRESDLEACRASSGCSVTRSTWPPSSFGSRNGPRGSATRGHGLGRHGRRHRRRHCLGRLPHAVHAPRAGWRLGPPPAAAADADVLSHRACPEKGCCGRLRRIVVGVVEHKDVVQDDPRASSVPRVSPSFFSVCW